MTVPKIWELKNYTIIYQIKYNKLLCVSYNWVVYSATNTAKKYFFSWKEIHFLLDKKEKNIVTRQNIDNTLPKKIYNKIISTYFPPREYFN